MRRALVLATTTARAVRFGRVLAPVGLLGGASLLSSARARKKIDYESLTGLPESWAVEAAKHALAGNTPIKSDGGYDIATFAGGCFWGVELRFQRVPGVIATASGYVQGHKAEPTYREVSARSTGHTEAVQLIFDPGVVSYADLLEIYWDRLGDDATRANAVGNDRGPSTTPASTRCPRNSSPPRRRRSQSARSASRSPSRRRSSGRRASSGRPRSTTSSTSRRAASPPGKRRRR